MRKTTGGNLLHLQVYGDGGDFNKSQLEVLSSVDEHGRSSIMKSLYRKFTDQLMGTIEEMGAP